METMKYEDIVNYKDMDPWKKAAQIASRETDAVLNENFGFRVLPWTRGESATLIETPWAYLALVVEGLGTKALVADLLRQAQVMYQISEKTYYDHAGHCNVAMAVNDVITVGALPIMYGQYVASGDSAWFKDQKRYGELIEGTKKACIQSGCTWAGGESPTLVDVLYPKVADLAGATVGIAMNKQHLINPANIRNGDVIIMLESSGIHANGLSTAREIAKKLGDDGSGYLTKMPDGRSYGETLLDKTHIYVPFIASCQDHGVKIHYAVNITGHGWRKLMRAMQPWTYVIERLPTQLPIFDFLQKHGPIERKAMYETYNMGAGFAVYVHENDVDDTLEQAAKNNLSAFVAGYIKAGPTQVIIKPESDLILEGNSLDIR